MSGFIGGPNNPLSRLTVASLQDMGYVVNMAAAEAYALPNLLQMAEDGMLLSEQQADHVHALPIFSPKVLPDSALHP